MKHAFFLALVLALAVADAPAAETEFLVASTSGTLTVGPDGGVVDVELADGGIGKAATDAYEGVIRQWRFEPVVEDGRPAQVRAHLQLSLIATAEAGSDETSLGIRNVWFLDPPKRRGGEPVGPSSELQPPVYPHRALAARAGAEVTLLVVLGEAGRVARVGTERVALLGQPQGGRAAAMAKMMSRAAERTAAGWRIAGYEAGQVVRVPVNFNPVRSGWQPMHPFDVEPEPWVVAATAQGGDVADLAAGGAPAAKLQLLTKLDPVADGG